MHAWADRGRSRNLRLVDDGLLNHSRLLLLLLLLLLLVVVLLEDGLHHGLLDDGGQINIGTHRGHIVGLSLIMARMIGMQIGSVGGVGHLRLEVDARVGRVDVARHGDGSCGDEGRLTEAGNGSRRVVGIRLARVVDEAGGLNRLAVRVRIEGSSVMNENLLTSSRNGRRVVEDWNCWLIGRWGLVARGLLTGTVAGRSSGGGSRSRAR